MSGLEILGVVLGVLPILMGMAKDERGRINTALSAISRGTEAKEREEFYEDFHFQTLQLKLAFRKIVNNLPLPEPQRETLLSTMEADGDPKIWTGNIEAYNALVELFGGESEWKAIEVLLNKVYRLFGTVLKDKTTRLLPKDQSQQKMYDRLLEFQKQHRLGQHKTRFVDRLRFLQRRKDRDVCLRNLKKWNDRLDRTIKTVCSNDADLKRNAIHMSSYPQALYGNSNMMAGGRSCTSSGAGLSFKDSETSTLRLSEVPRDPISIGKTPTKRFRELSKQLFAALSTYWTCGCPTQHEARFCLSDCVDNYQSNTELEPVKDAARNDDNPKPPRPLDRGSISFNFFFQIVSTKAEHSNQDGCWYEGTVDFTSATNRHNADDGKNSAQSDAMDTTQICKEFNTRVRARNSRFMRLLMKLEVEDDGGSKRLVDWKLQTRKTKHKLTLEGMRDSTLPFDSCLRQFKGPSLLQKRKLALIFAYSLLQLHDELSLGSQLLNSNWDKQHIYFFRRKPGTTLEVLDMEHPYLSTSSGSNSLSDHSKLKETGTVFHRSPGVLKLGLLLIEIHLWKCIEELRVADDVDPMGQNMNTDLYTAFRLVEESESFSKDRDAGYRALVEHCLNLPWPKAADSAEAQQEAVWEGVYKDIILPLEQELSSGLKDTKDFC